MPNLIDGESRENLCQLAKGGAVRTTAPNVIQQEALVLFSVQAEPARVFSRLAPHLVELPREQITHAAAGSYAFKDAFSDQRAELVAKIVRNAVFAVDMIQHEQVLDGKRLDPIRSHLLQKTQEVRILDLAVQGQRDLELVGVREVGQAFALTRLLQLGETRSGAEPQNAGVFDGQHTGGGNSWCHAWSR